MSKKEMITNEELLDLYRSQSGCTCENHVDIKSFKKWVEEGLVVKKGEKAIRLHAYIEYNKRDDSGKVTDDKNTIVKQFKACVFCRCQVEKIKG